MTYQEALDWIHGQLKFGIKPGLERMAWMLKELGNPQDNLKAVHIVGTNGKGSTVNALQTIFTQAGYEVGTFTSPYIIDFKERISLNGQMISEEDLLDLVNRVKPVVERLPKETEHLRRYGLEFPVFIHAFHCADCLFLLIQYKIT